MVWKWLEPIDVENGIIMVGFLESLGCSTIVQQGWWPTMVKNEVIMVEYDLSYCKQTTQNARSEPNHPSWWNDKGAPRMFELYTWFNCYSMMID